MTYRHAVVVACVVLAMLAAPAIAAQETATPTETTTEGSADTATPAENTTAGSSETAGLGAQLTAFAQSSSAAANGSVENGMWQAGFERSNASDRARLVRDRTGTLEQRLERLRAENETLRANYENGSVSEPAYVARQSRLSARIDALQTAVNDTDSAARQAGVNDSRLATLKQNASRLRGPEVAGIARGLGAGPPDHAGPRAGPRGGNGPPGSAGPSGAQPGGPATNQTGGGPPFEGGTPATNQTDGADGSAAGAGDGRPSGDSAGEGGQGDANGNGGPGGAGDRGPGNAGERGGSGNGGPP